MPCYHPLRAYIHITKYTKTGKKLIVFDRKQIKGPVTLEELPCGQCIGCKIDKSREWAIRCTNEAETYGTINNCYLTLTYNEDNIPENGNLRKKDFQNFMKEIRRQFHGERYVTYKGKTTRPIRFFHCGEYGESCRNCGMAKKYCRCPKYVKGIGRPHHHVCIFNFNFPDRVLQSEAEGYNLYSSEILAKLWKQGFHAIGDVTFESAAYVARYCCKKITGKKAEEHYKTRDPETGKLHKVNPEYITMSRRPGIGKQWYEKFKEEIFSRDCIIDKGRQIKMPKYYNKQFEETFPVKYEKIQRERRKHKLENPEEYTYEKLTVREKIKKAQYSQLERNL